MGMGMWMWNKSTSLCENVAIDFPRHSDRLLELIRSNPLSELEIEINVDLDINFEVDLVLRFDLEPVLELDLEPVLEPRIEDSQRQSKFEWTNCTSSPRSLTASLHN